MHSSAEGRRFQLTGFGIAWTWHCRPQQTVLGGFVWRVGRGEGGLPQPDIRSTSAGHRRECSRGLSSKSHGACCPLMQPAAPDAASTVCDGSVVLRVVSVVLCIRSPMRWTLVTRNWPLVLPPCQASRTVSMGATQTTSERLSGKEGGFVTGLGGESGASPREKG